MSRALREAEALRPKPKTAPHVRYRLPFWAKAIIVIQLAILLGVLILATDPVFQQAFARALRVMHMEAATAEDLN